MKDKENLKLALQILRVDNITKQKRGLHFIIASVMIWMLVLIVHISSLPIISKNLFTFFCSTPLLPLAYIISITLKIDFQNKDNPLAGLGLVFSLNQMLYLLIAMWVCTAVPEKMLMVYAIIFGAHLLPYGWLYQSKTYYFFSMIIPITALFVGLSYPSVAVAIFMLIIEVTFSLLLVLENRKSR